MPLISQTDNHYPIKVLIADDHELFRDGLKMMLKKIREVEFVGEAENGEELINKAKELKPDIIITDIKMPVLDGIVATKLLLKEFPNIGIIALSMFEEENLIIDMLDAGAKGYLLKNAQKHEITDAILTVKDGKHYYCTSTSRKLALMIAKRESNPVLKVKIPEFSSREIAIIQLICEEFTNVEIAQQLNLSKRTVEGYREKILEKVDAKSTAGLIVFAIKYKIYQTP